MQPAETPFDRTLLDGFDFACRPGCALCCYGSPAVSAVEAHQLLSIRPETELLPASQGFEQLPCRPDGGACVFLASERCTVREARPFPCRSFPVGVHIGARLQASLVLGCPGVNVEPLADWPDATSTPSRGLDEELASIEKEIAVAPLEAYRREAERRARAYARRVGMDPMSMDSELREAVQEELDTLLDTGLDPWEPPSAEAGLADLPLFFDPDHGRVALASAPGGWELLAVAEGGGVARHLGTFLPPLDLPSLDPSAERLLAGFLRYVLARDHTLWSVYEENPDAPSADWLAEELAERLAEVASTVISRAAVRGLAAGAPSDHLGAQGVADGIRATDMELLDRPTLGRIL